MAALPGEPNRQSRGYAAALLSAGVLSTTAIFIRQLTHAFGLPPLVLAFWRDGLVALSLLALLGVLGRGHARAARRQAWFLIVYGLVLAVFNALWIISVARNGAAVATVLVYCSAGFTALLGWWLLGERLDWVKLVAVALTLGGCVLVAEALDPAAWNANLGGILTGVLSGLAYAAYSLMGRSASQRGLDPWTTVLYTFGAAAVFLLLFNLIPAGLLPAGLGGVDKLLWLGPSLAGWGLLLALAAGPTLLGFGLYNMSLADLPSSVANLILTLEPVFTAALAYVLFGERLKIVQLAGSVMILGGVVFLRVFEGRRAPRARVPGAA